MSARAAAVERRTAETGIRLALNLDGTGVADIHTGIGFFDHMMTLMTAHGLLDLALVCDESITVGALEDCIAEAGGKLLRKIVLFDIYRGPGIAPGKKSVAFSLELRADDRTLTDEDSVNTVNRVLDALREKLDVVLR